MYCLHLNASYHDNTESYTSKLVMTDSGSLDGIYYQQLPMVKSPWLDYDIKEVVALHYSKCVPSLMNYYSSEIL